MDPDLHHHANRTGQHFPNLAQQLDPQRIVNFHPDKARNRITKAKGLLIKKCCSPFTSALKRASESGD